MAQVKEKMIENVELVESQLPVKEAEAKMKSRRVAFLPVFNDGRLTGIIAERDINQYRLENASGVDQLMVADVMKSHVKYVLEEHDLDEVTQLMKEQNQREVLVIGQDKDIKGILSLDQL